MSTCCPLYFHMHNYKAQPCGGWMLVRQVFPSKALFVGLFVGAINFTRQKTFTRESSTKQWLALLIVQEMHALVGRLVVEGNIRNCEVYNEQELIIL